MAARDRVHAGGLLLEVAGAGGVRGGEGVGFSVRGGGSPRGFSIHGMRAARQAWESLCPRRVSPLPLIPAAHLSGPSEPERRLRLMEVVRRRLRERRYAARTE